MEIRNYTEQDCINFASMPPLEVTVSARVIAILMKQPDIREKLKQYVKQESSHMSYEEIDEIIFKYISVLPLPQVLKDEMSNIIRPIRMQILEHCDCQNIDSIDSICWTGEATINKIETLKAIVVKYPSKFNESYFKLACSYCSEDTIQYFWNKLSVKTQKHYLRSKWLDYVWYSYRQLLLSYWTSLINNEMSIFLSKITENDNYISKMYNINHSLHKNMLVLMLSGGNVFAVKYFWKKLTDKEICSYLEEWVNGIVHKIRFYLNAYQRVNKYADILFFLLSKMNGEQQRNVFEKNSYIILNSLFQYSPWQRFLLPTVQVMWKFIDEKVFVQLLSSIGKEIQKRRTTHKLLRGLWNCSPMNLKKHFIRHIRNGENITDILINLLIVEDIKTVEIILNDAGVEEKKLILSSLIENSTKLIEVIFADKIFLLDILICILSESNFCHIKQRIALKVGDKLCNKWIHHNNWNRMELFFEWAFNSQNHILKNVIINKVEITYSLLKQSKYELANTFLNWSVKSKEDISRFKKYFAKSKPEIVLTGFDWCCFMKFLDWCFESDQDIEDYQSHILRSSPIPYIIIDVNCMHDFDFINKFINWCCHSTSEVEQFIKKLVLSDTLIETLRRWVNDYERNGDFTYWALIKKMIKFIFPHLKENLSILLKENIANYRNFHDIFSTNGSNRITKTHLYRLIDGEDFNISDENSTDDKSKDSADY